MALAPPPLSPSSRLLDDPPANPATEVSSKQEIKTYTVDELDLKVAAFRRTYNKPETRCFTLSSIEVFSAVIDELTGSRFYGKIEMDGPAGFIKLFERVRGRESYDDDDEFVNHLGSTELLLSFPSRQNMFTTDRVTFCIEFTTDDDNNKTYKHFFTFQEIGVYDTVLSATLSHHAVGSLTLNFAAFKYPVAAKVRVVLLHQDRVPGGGGEKNYAHHVVGQIFAINSLYQENKSMLFFSEEKKKTPDDNTGSCVIADDEKLVPLSKSILVLPNLADHLLVVMDLTDANTGLSIVDDEAVFQIPSELLLPITNESMTVKIPVSQTIGTNIRVTVTWGHLINESD